MRIGQYKHDQTLVYTVCHPVLLAILPPETCFSVVWKHSGASVPLSLLEISVVSITMVHLGCLQQSGTLISVYLPFFSPWLAGLDFPFIYKLNTHLIFGKRRDRGRGKYINIGNDNEATKQLSVSIKTAE